MNPNKSKKRLSLDVETVRVLQSDELADVAGGNGDQQAFVKLSVTVSVGGNCKCCARGGGEQLA